MRRSKSQRNFVTSIQHGGSVTLVSLNGDSMNNQKDSEIKHVHHHHFVPPFLDPLSGQSSGSTTTSGSQTLPRKGSKKISMKPSSSDDSEVVIKKQGVNGVKIQLNLNLEAEELSEKRKYTLEELEVEGFSSSSGKNSDYDEEVDLNSLIEGDVDEIDEDSHTLGKQTAKLVSCLCSLFIFRGKQWHQLASFKKSFVCCFAPKKFPCTFSKLGIYQTLLIYYVVCSTSL